MTTPNFEAKTAFTATAKQNTWLKDFPQQAVDCGHVFQAGKGDTYPVHQVTSNYNGHVYLLFGSELEGSHRWWGYAPDWLVEGNAPDNDPKVQPLNVEELPPVPEPEIEFHVPGISAALKPSSPIFVKGEATNFTWGEATANGTRIPTNPKITQNIVRAAAFMQSIREFLGGHSIGITSWYRDPKTNREVGGSSLSFHMEGHAVDFYVVGDVVNVVDAFYKLKPFVGSRGGLAVGNGFVHVDLRGYASRWAYSGGPQVTLW